MGGFAKSRAEPSFLLFRFCKKAVFDMLIIFLADRNPLFFSFQPYPVHLQLPDIIQINQITLMTVKKVRRKPVQQIVQLPIRPDLLFPMFLHTADAPCSPHTKSSGKGLR